MVNAILLNKYSKGYSSGNTLASMLGIPVYTFRKRPSVKKSRSIDFIINWGRGLYPEWMPIEDVTIINKKEAVANAANKLKTFLLFQESGVPCPSFTTDKEVAKLVFNEKKLVVARTLLNGSNGRGIVIASSPEEVVDAKLYTTYIRKVAEYRLHVLNGEVITAQQKRKLNSESLSERGIADTSKYIRNVANGYIFSTSLDASGALLDAMKEVSIKAVDALGLNFGAVDLLVDKKGRVYALEVNTAPGLQGSTLASYVEAFSKLIKQEDLK